jgi:hypothetical protein
MDLRGLPTELLSLIASHLTRKHDLMSLRLTCTRILKATARECGTRLFRDIKTDLTPTGFLELAHIIETKYIAEYVWLVEITKAVDPRFRIVSVDGTAPSHPRGSRLGGMARRDALKDVLQHLPNCGRVFWNVEAYFASSSWATHDEVVQGHEAAAESLSLMVSLLDEGTLVKGLMLLLPASKTGWTSPPSAPRSESQAPETPPGSWPSIESLTISGCTGRSPVFPRLCHFLAHASRLESCSLNPMVTSSAFDYASATMIAHIRSRHLASLDLYTVSLDPATFAPLLRRCAATLSRLVLFQTKLALEKPGAWAGILQTIAETVADMTYVEVAGPHYGNRQRVCDWSSLPGVSECTGYAGPPRQGHGWSANYWDVQYRYSGGDGVEMALDAERGREGVGPRITGFTCKKGPGISEALRLMARYVQEVDVD